MSDDKYSREESVNQDKQEGEDSIVTDRRNETLEILLSVLTNQHRRHILYYLQDHPQTSLRAVATHVTAVRKGTSFADVDALESEQTRTVLLHRDLPVLEDAGLIEYDHRSGAIQYENPPAILDGFLQLTARVDLPENHQ